jgi:hypothetical protein
LQIFGVVIKEIWYRPDMYLDRDMLFTLDRNKKLEEAQQVWSDLKSEEVQLYQHTYGDMVRPFCDSGLINFAMELYEDMRGSPDLHPSLPFLGYFKGTRAFP